MKFWTHIASSWKCSSPAFVQIVQDKHPNQNSYIVEVFEPDSVTLYEPYFHFHLFPHSQILKGYYIADLSPNIRTPQSSWK